MNGDVAWTNTTRPSAPGASSPSASRACSSADSLEAVAPASSAGRATISAPASRAASAIASSSVLTTTRPIRSAASAAFTARATSGTPPTRARFLPGSPCEPPRAGMIAVARAPGAAASGAPIAPGRTRAAEGASRRSAWVVMPRSYAARADGRCTPGERRATVRSTVDAGGAGAARWCRRRPWRRPSTTPRMPQAHGPRHPPVSVATGAGAVRPPSRRSRAAWRGSSARRRPGSARGGPRPRRRPGRRRP